MFETIRRQFLVEVTGDGDPARHHVTSLDEVNQLLDHRVHKACHQQVHSETGQTPRQRWEAAAPADLQAVGRLREALAWTVPATGPPHNPHRTRTLISLVARRQKGLLVGVTARTWAPADGVELCPVLAGQRWTRATGCWVRMPGTGIAGHGGRDGRRELDKNNVYLQLYRFKTDRTVDHATEHLPPLNRQVRPSAGLVVLARWSLLAGLVGPVPVVMAGVLAED